jgi:hypothetical protein
MLLALRPEAASDLKLSSFEARPRLPGHFFAFTFLERIRFNSRAFVTLRGGRAILRYYPRLLFSWPTSSTDAPRLWSIPEAVESSFPAFSPRCENELRTAEYSVRPSLSFWRHFPFAFHLAFYGG